MLEGHDDTFFRKKADLLLEELTADCEYWRLRFVSQREAYRDLSHFLAGLECAQLIYKNRIMRELPLSFILRAEQRAGRYIEILMERAKRHWPDC